MITFKREISIDGVVAICAIVAALTWAITLKTTQDTQGRVLDGHTTELKEIHSILVSEQLKNEAVDVIRSQGNDHETRIRSLEKNADFLRLTHP